MYFLLDIRLLNTGKINSKLDSVYFSAWADPDLGEGFMKTISLASDTLLNSGFVYNSSDSDPGFGTQIPSFFITLLQGPHSYIPGETFIRY